MKSIGDNAVLQKIASEGLSFAKKTKGLKKRGQNLMNNKENLMVHKSDMNSMLRRPLCICAILAYIVVLIYSLAVSNLKLKFKQISQQFVLC